MTSDSTIAPPIQEGLILKPMSLLGGYDAAQLWPAINLALLTWIPLLVAPRWKYTPTITLIAPIVHASMYTLALLSLVLFAGGENGKEDEEDDENKSMDMMTLEGVVNLFKDPTGVFVGWVHYCVYDALVGRWIALDYAKKCGKNMSFKFHVLVMVPLLGLAMMFAPTGWLLYVAVVRPFFLPNPQCDEDGSNVVVGGGSGGGGGGGGGKSKGKKQ